MEDPSWLDGYAAFIRAIQAIVRRLKPIHNPTMRSRASAGGADQVPYKSGPRQSALIWDARLAMRDSRNSRRF